jgi:hypothetical protein
MFGTRAQSSRMLPPSEEQDTRDETPPMLNREKSPPSEDLDALLEEERHKVEQLEKKAELRRLKRRAQLLRDESEPPASGLTTASFTTSSDRGGPSENSSESAKEPNPKALNIYYGRSTKEHADFTRSAELAFRVAPRRFSTDSSRVAYVLQYLSSEIADTWLHHEKSMEGNASWEYLSDYLLNLIEDPENRDITIRLRFNRAMQQPGQSAMSFHTYLASLEAQMSPKPTKTSAADFLTRLRPELREAIRELGELPITRDAMLQKAIRVESARKHSRSHSEPLASDRSKKIKTATQTEVVTQVTRSPNDNSNQKPSQRNRTLRKNMICSHCKRPGHYAKICWAKNGRPNNPNLDPVSKKD